MLLQDELKGALADGLKAAGVCGRFCKAGAEIEGSNDRYRIWHNGAGSRDTDVQSVFSQAVLGHNRDAMAGRIKAWVIGLHRGGRLDWNTAMATGGLVSAGGVYVIGEAGLELCTAPAHGTISSSVALWVGERADWTYMLTACGPSWIRTVDLLLNDERDRPYGLR
jgi:hypothetical protein